MKTFRSLKSFSASVFVGATTTNGFLSLEDEIDAETTAWAHSGTKISAL